MSEMLTPVMKLTLLIVMPNIANKQSQIRINSIIQQQ